MNNTGAGGEGFFFFLNKNYFSTAVVKFFLIKKFQFRTNTNENLWKDNVMIVPGIHIILYNYHKKLSILFMIKAYELLPHMMLVDVTFCLLHICCSVSLHH